MEDGPYFTNHTKVLGGGKMLRCTEYCGHEGGEEMRFWKLFLVASLLILPFMAVGESLATLTPPTTTQLNFALEAYSRTHQVFAGVVTAGMGDANGTTLSTSGLAIASYNLGDGVIHGVSNSSLAFTTGAWNGSGWNGGGTATITLNGTLIGSGTTLGTTYQLVDTGLGLAYQVTLSGLSITLNSEGIKMLGLGSGKGYNWTGAVTLNFLADGTGRVYLGSAQGNTSSVPIPPTALLLGAGLVGLGIIRKRVSG